jgi:hypothetical protein
MRRRKPCEAIGGGREQAKFLLRDYGCDVCNGGLVIRPSFGGGGSPGEPLPRLMASV